MFLVVYAWVEFINLLARVLLPADWPAVLALSWLPGGVISSSFSSYDEILFYNLSVTFERAVK